MEKITPFKDPTTFAFKYVCLDQSSQFSNEVVKYRHFSIPDGPDPV